MTGGNGACHCVHVSELLTRVDAIELPDVPRDRRVEASSTERGRDPWQPGYNGPARHSGGDRGANSGAAATPGGRETLPLPLEEPLGALLHKFRSPFDDKLTTNQEYQFDGLKGGFSWKGKVERQFISRVPIFKQILEWAE